MSCENDCFGDGKIKAVILIGKNDFTFDKDGKFRIKRKYGKFKREIVRIK